MMMMFITSWQETNARRGEGERNAKKRESSSGEKVHASSHDTGELYLLKWFPTPHHYLPCPAVPSCPCDKLLRECSGGCKVRTLTVCGPRNSALRRSIIPLRAAHDTVLLVRPGALPQRTPQRPLTPSTATPLGCPHPRRGTHALALL